MYSIIMDNIGIKSIKALTEKKGREKAEAFIVEGKRFVEEVASWPVQRYVVSESYARQEEVEFLNPLIVSDHMFKKLSDTVTPQGIMAVCGKREYQLEELLKPNCLLLLCEGLSDPGNLGALIRTADAASADGVILSKNTVELFSPKVIRASAGSIFHLPCIEHTDALACVDYLKKNSVSLAAAVPRDGVFLYDFNMKKSCCVVIGNESHGLSEALISACDARITIPMDSRAESLNASIAGSIVLYEAVRQRL